MRHFWNIKCSSSSACVFFFLGLSYSHISTSPLFIISINLSLVEKQLYPSNLLNSFILSFILISLYLILWFYYLLYESCSNFQFTPRSLMVEKCSDSKSVTNMSQFLSKARKLDFDSPLEIWRMICRHAGTFYVFIKYS